MRTRNESFSGSPPSILGRPGSPWLGMQSPLEPSQMPIADGESHPPGWHGRQTANTGGANGGQHELGRLHDLDQRMIVEDGDGRCQDRRPGSPVQAAIQLPRDVVTPEGKAPARSNARRYGDHWFFASIPVVVESVDEVGRVQSGLKEERVVTLL